MAGNAPEFDQSLSPVRPPVVSDNVNNRPLLRYNLGFKNAKQMIRMSGGYPNKIKIFVARSSSGIASFKHSTALSPDNPPSESEVFENIQLQASAEALDEVRKAKRKETAKSEGGTESRETRKEDDNPQEEISVVLQVPSVEKPTTPEPPGDPPENDGNSKEGDSGESDEDTIVQQTTPSTPTRSDLEVPSRQLQFGEKEKTPSRPLSGVPGRLPNDDINTPGSVMSMTEFWEHQTAQGRVSLGPLVTPKIPSVSRSDAWANVNVTPDSTEVVQKFLILAMINALTNACYNTAQSDEDEPDFIFQLFDDQDTLNSRAFTKNARNVISRLVDERIGTVEVSRMSTPQQSADWGKEIKEIFPELFGEEALTNDGRTSAADL